MGYGVMAFAVDLDAIRADIGSKSQEALALYGAKLENDGELAEMIRSHSDEGDGAPTPHDLLRHLIMGEPYDEGLGFAYAYCFKHMVDVRGQFLDNSAWLPIRLDHLDKVQAALTAAGVDEKLFSIQAAIWSGPPIALPPIDDFPGIGVVSKERIAPAQAAVAGVDVDKIDDDDVRASVQSLHGWLTLCVQLKRDLVCFYH
jgi:hypothetical protein